jgi:hypothetical protein
MSAESPGWWRELLFPAPEEVSPGAFWGRVALLAGLTLWSLRFLVSSVADNYAGESFLHLVNLVFHEAGHVIFAPFGELLTAAGGSLMQLLVPAVCLATFLLRNRDPFASAVALWWEGESLMDLAPYIADARAGELVLLGGVTGRDAPGYHDWENVLSTLGVLHWDTLLGGLAHNLGRLLLLAACAWAGWSLLSRRRVLSAARASGS